MAEDLNTVPLGRGGTGAAFLLGNNRAVTDYVRRDDLNQQREYKNELLAQKQAQDLAKQYKQNSLNLQGGRFWQDQIQQKVNELAKQGANLIKQNVNPDLNTDYVQNKLALKALNDKRLSYENSLKSLESKYSQNEGDYESDFVDKINALSKMPIEDALSQPLPTLQKKYKFGDLSKGLQPVREKNSTVVNGVKYDTGKVLTLPTRQSIEAKLETDDNAQRFLEKNTGLPFKTIKGLSSSFEQNKKELYEDYKLDPEFKNAINSQYQITDARQLDDVLQTIAKKNTDAKNMYNDFVDKETDNLKSKYIEYAKKNPDFTIQNFNLRQQKANQSRQAFELKMSGGDNGDVGDVERRNFRFAEKNANVNVDFVPIKNTSFFVPPIKATDLSTGKEVNLDGTTKVTVISVDKVPYAINRVDKTLNNAVAQPDYVKNGKLGEDYELRKKLHVVVEDKFGMNPKEYYLNYNSLPVEVKTKKNIQEALNKLGADNDVKQQPVEQKPKKTKTSFKNIIYK